MKEALENFKGEPVVIENQPGHITDALAREVERVVGRGEGKIFVDGEEDLAALVVLSVAPDGAVVVYGQPDEGPVLVRVNDEVRGSAKTLLDKMLDQVL